MPIERPTFHESWYRVAELHPRLRSTVQISRQHFRSQPWHVIQDHTNNAFFRLAEPAYQFVGLLDGKRSVGDAWTLVNTHLGDDAPTQGEVIQLLGQLYTSNLLQAEVPADTHTLFARYKKRKQREITGYLMNIMFARVPIFDPDAFLNRWLPLLGWIFSPIGLVVWLVLMGFGIHSIANVSGWQDKLSSQSNNLLKPDNILLLYVAFALIKACHEMGHAISCKKFGRQSGTGGEVHVIGIMFLVFTPVPYVDASSSWALTNKWHRAIVGAAGMWVELAIASVAAMVWSQTADTQAIHSFAFNVMFVASFSTIIFNANPLLRYDGYYILSDLLEIPNLAQRSKDYIFFLVKRWLWNIRFARNPAHSNVEQFWLFLYAITSFLMRVYVSVRIMFYLTTVLNGTLIILATGMAIAGMVTWVLMPAGKYVHYLFTNPELSRVRSRAIMTSFVFVAAIVIGVGFVPAPDHARAQGVVEPDPAYMMDIFPHEDGAVTAIPIDIAGQFTRGPDALYNAFAMPVIEKGATILQAYNRDLERQLAEKQADRRRFTTQLDAALDDKTVQGPGEALKAQAALRTIDEQIKQLNDRIDSLNLKSPLTGVLIAPELEDKRYAYLQPKDRVGMVADLHHLIIRAAAANELGGQLSQETTRQVEIRVNDRPDILLTGTISALAPSGSNQLPAASLGYQIGGELNTAADDRNGTKTVENFFEIRIDNLQLVSAPQTIQDDFKKTGNIHLLPGQRVIVRFTLAPKPLAAQAWTALLQVFQKKFQL